MFNTKCSDQQVEFLDILHKNLSDSPFKFVTSNYVKKTALDRTFINGTLYRPLWVFQSIVVSEAMRMRCICEDKPYYDTSLEYLKNKCFKSKFPKTLTSKIIEQAKSWVDRFHPIKNSKLKKNKQKKNRMGYPVSKTTVVWPDGKMSAIKRNACIQVPTDTGQFCRLL